MQATPKVQWSELNKIMCSLLTTSTLTNSELDLQKHTKIHINVHLQSKATNITETRQSTINKPIQRWTKRSVHYQISVLLPALLSARACSVSCDTVTGGVAVAENRFGSTFICGP